MTEKIVTAEDVKKLAEIHLTEMQKLGYAQNLYESNPSPESKKAFEDAKVIERKAFAEFKEAKELQLGKKLDLNIVKTSL